MSDDRPRKDPQVGDIVLYAHTTGDPFSCYEVGLVVAKCSDDQSYEVLQFDGDIEACYPYTENLGRDTGYFRLCRIL